MITIGGVLYYVDIKTINELVEKAGIPACEEVETTEITQTDKDGAVFTSVSKRTYIKPKEINGLTYDLINNLLITVMEVSEECDDNLGVENMFKKQSIAFKLAFNTLRFNKIIKEI